jgi:hypothetical protein
VATKGLLNENIEECVNLQGISNQVTPCNTNRLQKLIVAKADKEFPANVETMKFIIIIIIIIIIAVLYRFFP